MRSSQSPLPRSTVVLTPLGAVISGLSLTKPSTGVPPWEENDIITGSGYCSESKMGFLSKRTAPTAIAPAALGWPTMVEVPCTCSNWVKCSPPRNRIYLKVTEPVPLALATTISDSTVSPSMEKGTTSMGKPSTFSRLNPSTADPSKRKISRSVCVVNCPPSVPSSH